MPNLPAADLAAVLRAVPPGASSASGAVRRARAAWERAPRFVRAQTAVLLAADPRGGEEPLSPGGEPLSADRLPCALALATLASTEDWTGLDPAEADALGADVLRRLASAGYPTEGLAPLDAAAAAWLDGDGRTQPQRIARAEALVAGDAPPPANLRLARALLRAAHRACLHGLHGLVLPAEVRAALAGMTLPQAAQASGSDPASLSRWAGGSRRISDDAALWVLGRIEAESRKVTA